MSRKATTKETIRKNAVKSMQALGVYKPSYNTVIDIYAELCEQYEKLTADFKKDYAYSSCTADGGEKKSPLMSTIECLRKDILLYSDRLCLNPKSNQKEQSPPGKKSKLAATLERIG